MAGWRQAVALAMTGEEIEALTALSRSRTEPRQAGCRGRRCCSAIRRSHRSLPWDEDLACIIQTVQRCVEQKQMADGALAKATLDDRPRPGKEPTITPEAKAWLVSLACDKAKEHGYPHELWTTRFLARHEARARTGGGSPMGPPPVWLKAPCASFSVKRKSSRTRCATIWNAATPSSSPRWRKFCVSTARVQVLKKAAAKAEKSKKPVAIVSYDEKPGIQAIATTAPDLPPVPGRHGASFARDHEHKRRWHAQPVGRGSICSPARSTRSSGSATAAASSSNSSSFSMPPIRPVPRSS